MAEWIMKQGRPVPVGAPDVPEDPLTKPFPLSIWRVESAKNSGLPFTGLMTSPLPCGAFANNTNLEYVRIPPSVKKIGKYAFANTKLTSVTIAKDCVYDKDTSFPEGCVVNFYP